LNLLPQNYEKFFIFSQNYEKIKVLAENLSIFSQNSEK